MERLDTRYTHPASHTHTRAHWVARERERLTLPGGRDLITHRRKKFNMQFYEFVFYHLVGLRSSETCAVNRMWIDHVFFGLCVFGPSTEWEAAKTATTTTRKNWARLNDGGYREGIVCIFSVCECDCELFLSPINLFAKYNYSISVHTVVNKEVEMAHAWRIRILVSL